MKKLAVLLVIMIVGTTVLGQQNSIETLINSNGKTIEITIEQSYQINDREELTIKKYKDLTDNKSYFSIEMFDCIFEKGEYDQLLLFFKRCVETQLKTIDKNEFGLQYNSVGGARITFVKTEGSQSSLLFRQKGTPGFYKLILPKDIEEVYSILSKLSL